jgi:lysophospholipase L1-like esterase
LFHAVPSPLNPLTTEPAPAEVDPTVLDSMRRGRSNASQLVWARVVSGCLSHDFAKGGGGEPHLRRIVQVCRQAGARLTVVYIPASVSVHPAHVAAQQRLNPSGLAEFRAPAGARFRAQQEHLRSVTEAIGVPFLDLTDAFVHAEAERDRLFWPVDTHCNAEGYHLVADACARHWADQSDPRTASASTRRPLRR